MTKINIKPNIRRHPFYRKEFIKVWSDYFLKKNQEPLSFRSLGPLHFFKHSKLSLYTNIGKNITNGNIYQIDPEATDYSGKSFLLYDIPSYLQKEPERKHQRLAIKKIPQYKGYLSDLDGFDSLDAFMQHKFSAKSRNNIRKWRKKLYNNFEIDFKVYRQEVDETTYHKMFDALLDLIQKRWGELGMQNDIVVNKAYYRDLGYSMIKEGSAALYVLSDNGKPIAISLSFLSETELFFAITTFDTDFRRYNLGHMLIMHMLEWCIENNIRIFDYSKGTYDYKIRWATKEYVFENHLIYDTKKIRSILVSRVLFYMFSFKQFLREKEVNLLFSRLKYYLKNEKPKKEQILTQKMDEEWMLKLQLEEIPYTHREYDLLRGLIFDLIFSKPQAAVNVKLYRQKDKLDSYVISGKDLCVSVQIQ
ncbi:MAG: GNAT family N-acetyltransferase [Flavobacteriaceae bacterium]|nr:GNAT family N-acetyltransferase [Flavobacteriaceae bacterium]